MKKLSWTQRIALAEGIKAGKSNAQIAREIGVHRSTVGREIARNADSRESYAPVEADLRFWYRQKEAMPKRFLITFCGVEFYMQLQKRNRIYTYISRTHPNKLSRQQNNLFNSWESAFRQSEKNRLRLCDAFMRVSDDFFPAFSFNQKFSRSQDSNSSSTSFFSFHSDHPDVSLQNFFKPLSSISSVRMPFSVESAQKLFTSSPQYPGQKPDELSVSAYNLLASCEQKNLSNSSRAFRQQNMTEYVRFFQKNKNNSPKITFNLLKTGRLAVRN